MTRRALEMVPADLAPEGKFLVTVKGRRTGIPVNCTVGFRMGGERAIIAGLACYIGTKGSSGADRTPMAPDNITDDDLEYMIAYVAVERTLLV
jgi:hypothetical protein